MERGERSGGVMEFWSDAVTYCELSGNTSRFGPNG